MLSLFLSFFVSISLCSRDVSNGFGSILRVDGARNAVIVFLTRDWCRFISSLLHKQVDLSSDEVYKRARARIENRWKRGDECLEWRRDGERRGETRWFPEHDREIIGERGQHACRNDAFDALLNSSSLVFGSCSEPFFFERGWIIFDSCFWIYIWQWITIHIVFFFLFIIYWKTFIILVFEYLWRVFVVFFLMYLFMKIIGEYFCFLFFEICRMILYNDNLFILCILKIDVVLVWKRYFHFFHWIL